jgi:hypothetical protein
VSSQAHDRKLNDGRVREPKVVEMATQTSGFFRSQVKGNSLPWQNGVLSEFTPTVQ